MRGLKFAWDASKERGNLRKHGVSFIEAAKAFQDPHARRFYDLRHSEDEDRFILLGMSPSARLLVVCHCHREEVSTIRIIPARKANGQETQDYERQRFDA
ncbi:MAG: BrnT family toxin [Elusimicrobia bacterium]|nr:BrnT family toxin [Elusimicrobiota bacterium]